MRKLLLVFTLPALLSGCVLAAVGAGTEVGTSLAEERSLGSKVDDSVIYTDISNRLIQKGTNKLYLKVTIKVRNGRVMLTGIVQTQDAAQQAVSLAWQAKGVQEVINELIVAPDNSYSEAANDSLIKKNLESRLLFTKNVWVINYSIDVVNGTAYLLGKVLDRAELNRVMNVTKTTKGIKRVVSHLQIKSELAADGSSAPPVAGAPTATYDAPNYQNTPYYGGGGGSPAAATDGTISTDSVSSSPVAPASGGY